MLLQLLPQKLHQDLFSLIYFYSDLIWARPHHLICVLGKWSEGDFKTLLLREGDVSRINNRLFIRL